MNYRNISIGGLPVLFGIALGACSWLPGAELRAQPENADPTGSALVEIVSGGLLASPSGDQFELGLTLVNRSDRLLWVQAHFLSPDGLSDCVVAKEMKNGDRGLFICSQAIVLPNVDYPVEITMFNDIEQTVEVGKLSADLRFE